MELEAQIEILRDNKRKYQHVIKLAQMLANQLSQMIQTQRQLGDAFVDLSLKSPELRVSLYVHEYQLDWFGFISVLVFKQKFTEDLWICWFLLSQMTFRFLVYCH